MKTTVPRCRFCRHYRDIRNTVFCALRMRISYQENRRAFSWAKVRKNQKACPQFKP